MGEGGGYWRGREVQKWEEGTEEGARGRDHRGALAQTGCAAAFAINPVKPAGPRVLIREAISTASRNPYKFILLAAINPVQ